VEGARAWYAEQNPAAADLFLDDAGVEEETTDTKRAIYET
jgi:hypothetical protein